MNARKISPLACAWLLLAACSEGGATDEASDASDAAEMADGGAPDASVLRDAEAGSAAEAGTDCTDSQAQCIAGEGVRNGASFTCVAARPLEEVVRIEVGTPRWNVRCDDGLTDFSLGIEFPVQQAGAIDLSTAPPGDGPLKFYVRAVSGSAGGSMTERSTNLATGTLSGTLAADNLATGTLNASWSAPAAGCVSGETNSACAEGSLKVTFRITLP